MRKAVLYTVVGLGAAAGGGLLGLLLDRVAAGSPPPVCPTGDVEAPCPSGYIPDPAYPGCCQTGNVGGGFTFYISNQSGNLVLSCAACASTEDLVFQVSGATPNGKISFFISFTQPGDWQSLLNPLGTGPYIATADAYGDLSLPWSSCYIQAIDPATGYGYGVCPGAGEQFSPVYIVAFDEGSGTYSDVITLNSVCASGNCCQGGC
jgi:hypothetical protein